MKRKIYSAFFAVLISIGMMLLPCTASAAENSKTQDGLAADIVSEKDSYSIDEDIDLTFKVTNTNEYAVKNVSLEAIIPDGLTIKNKADTSIDTVSLASGESLEFTLTVVKESTVGTVPTNSTVTDKENPTETQSVSEQVTEGTNSEKANTTVVQTDNTQGTTAKVSQSAVSDNSNTNSTNGSDNSTIQTGYTVSYLLVGLICLACAFAVVISFRIRKNSKRYISLVLCLSIIFGSVSAVGIPIVYASENGTESFTVTKAIIADNTEYELGANVKYNKKISDDENAVTRGEWVDMLVNEFSMSAVNSDDYEIPYTDIADSKYFDSIFTAYYYAILPTDIEAFKPDEYASRDFAALTLNNCLCCVKNNDLSCDDFESIENKEAVSALVERGYFTLTDNKFMPNKAVTTDEMKNISSLIQQSLNALEIDENHKNVVDVQDNAVVIKDDVVTSIGENVVTLKATEETSALKVGDVFFTTNPRNDALTVAYKVESVDNSESEITLSVSEPELYEMYKNIDIQGTVKTQPAALKSRSIDNNSVVQGFTIFPSFNYGDTIPIDASKLQFNKTYTIDDGDGDKIEVKLNGGLENPELEYKVKATYNPFVPIIPINNDFEFYVSLKNELKFYGEASVTFGQGKSGRLQIAKIPVPICPGISVDISVDLVVNASGKISIEYSLKNQVGVFLDKNGLQLKKDFKDPEFLPKAEMDVTLGLSPSVELNAVGFIVGADAEIGAKASGKAALLKDDKIHTDLSAHMYFNADIYTDGLLKNFLEAFNLKTEKTFEIINKDNSPLKGDLHLEGMEILNKCTYRYAKGKITNESSIPIDDVTVEVYIYNTDKSPVCTDSTSDFGEFGMLIPKGEAGYPDNLVFKFAKDGYESIEKSVKINTGKDTDLGTIEMKKSSEQDEENYKEDFINALINNQTSWNTPSFGNGNSMTTQIYFMDINFDDKLELVTDYMTGSGGTCVEVYGYQNGQIVHYNIDKNARLIDSFNYYYDTAEKKYRIFGTDTTKFCSDTSQSHKDMSNYELVVINDTIYKDFYTSYCPISGYYDLYRKGSPVDGYTEGVYNYNIAGPYSDSQSYDKSNSERLKNSIKVDINKNTIISDDWKIYSDFEKKEALEKAYDSFTYDKY